MRRNIIRGIIVILLIGILTGGCNQKKNKFTGIRENQETSGEITESGGIDKAEEEFYSELHGMIKNAGLYPNDSPLEAPYHDFTLENLEGEQVSLSDFDGQTILLNFWALWCGPCVREMPSMEKLYEDLKDEGFVIIAVDLGDSKASVEKYVARAELTFPVLLDKTQEIGSIYGASSIPLSYIIDTEGYIVGAALGTLNWNTAKIKEMLRFIQDRNS